LNKPLFHIAVKQWFVPLQMDRNILYLVVHKNNTDGQMYAFDTIIAD